MLTEWCRVRLLPPDSAAAAAAAASASAGEDGASASDAAGAAAVDVTGGGASASVRVGSVLRAGTPSDRALLTDQFLHKSLVLLVYEMPDGGYVGAVLNRPTANLVQFHTEGKPKRCISFGGDGRLRGAGLDIDSNGLMWLGQSAKLAGVMSDADGELGSEPLGLAMGDSGLRRVPAMGAADAIKAGDLALNDFLLVSGARAARPPSSLIAHRIATTHTNNQGADE